jgi:hypothetical protein
MKFTLLATAVVVGLVLVLLTSCAPARQAATSDPDVVKVVSGSYPLRRVVDEGACVVVYLYGDKGGVAALPISETNLHVDGCPLQPRPSQ